jgi:short-subunit dehydrogenase
LNVFITGASSGIGAALAREFARRGAMLGLVARRQAVLDELAAQLPGVHRTYAVDVTDRDAIAAAGRDFDAASGGADLVIANAGISVGVLTEHYEDLDAFRQVLDTNVLAMAHTFHPFIAPMRHRRRGTLAGIASVAGIRGLPGSEAYCASKAAAISYLESLRVELRRFGVRVVTIAPGFVRTPLTARNPYRMPSITELLFDLDLGERVVGRTGFCIHPRERVANVAKVGGTKDVKLDVLRRLAPTHVIVNIDENEAPTVDAIRAFVPHVIVTHPNAPADNLALYRLLGGVFDREAQAEALCTHLQAELDACAALDWPRETALYLIWKKPWMTVAADTYIARTLARVGWIVTTPAGGERGAARYPVVDDLDAEVARVDRVLASTEPFMFREQHVAELRARYPGKPIELIDGEMTSWYGSRAIRGLAYLRGLRAER